MSWKRAMNAGAKQQLRNQAASDAADAAAERRARRKKVVRRLSGRRCDYCRKPAEFHDNLTGHDVCGGCREKLEGM